MTDCPYCTLIFPDDEDWYDHLQMEHGEVSDTVDVLFDLIDSWEVLIADSFGGDTDRFRQYLIEIHHANPRLDEVIFIYDNYIEHIRDLYLNGE